MDEQTSLSAMSNDDDLFGDVTEADVSEMLSDEETADTEAEQAEAENTNGQETAETAKETSVSDLFEVVYNGEKKSLSKEEMITNAQKGLNYDKMMNRLNEYQTRISELDELAKSLNLENSEKLKDYISNSVSERELNKRVDELIEQGYYEEQAKYVAGLEMKQKQSDRVQTKQKQAEERANEVRKTVGDFMVKNPDFIKRFPNAELPKEMVTAIENGATISEAWNGFLLQESIAKSKELEAKIAELERLDRNGKSAAPEVSGGQKPQETDPFLQGFL